MSGQCNAFPKELLHRFLHTILKKVSLEMTNLSFDNFIIIHNFATNTMQRALWCDRNPSTLDSSLWRWTISIIFSCILVCKIWSVYRFPLSVCLLKIDKILRFWLSLLLRVSPSCLWPLQLNWLLNIFSSE